VEATTNKYLYGLKIEKIDVNMMMWSNIAIHLSDIGTCSSGMDGRRTFTLRTGDLLQQFQLPMPPRINRSKDKVTRPFIDELKEAALAERLAWHGPQHY